MEKSLTCPLCKSNIITVMNNEPKSELTELELLIQINNNLKKLIENNEIMSNSIQINNNLKKLIKHNEDMHDSINCMTNNILTAMQNY